MSRRRRHSGTTIAAPPAPRRERWFGVPRFVALGLLASLVVLLAHVRVYQFLTDDSYISFRYARNLAHGFGLVFNPGYEHVEGYSNFLWVVLLAGLDKLGIVPERAANPLSIAMTVALWAVVVGFARRRVAAGREWLVLIPALGLALTRSVAVWSTSGLETRCFEVLVVAGVLRMIDELEAIDAGRAPRAIACWLLAGAALTRPDGMLIAGCAFLVGAAWTRVHHPARLIAFVRRQLPFAALVLGHLAFRRAYYHDWLPNTYYAKVGGHLWWASGFKYLTAFVIEYGVLWWIPLLAVPGLLVRGRRLPLLPLMVAAVVLPHVLYIVSIGGDHFEYRPFDVYFPFAFLLLQQGAARWLERGVRAPVLAGYLALVALGLTTLPWASHREFINYYRPGFPGAELKQDPAAASYLDPARDPILRLPGLRPLALLHRDLTRWMTFHFVAIRAEEHRMFLATSIDEGSKLRRLRDDGVLPADTYIAIDCVGAIPYISDFRTLDRLGLTDAHVAHSPMIREAMAHGKSATLDYGRARGVDLWSIDPVHLIQPVNSSRMMVAFKDGMVMNRPYYAVDVGDMGYLICQLPMGLAATRRRLNLNIMSFGDSTFIRTYLTQSRQAYTDSLIANPYNLRAARYLGYVLLLSDDYVAARYHYQVMTTSYPQLLEGFENLALCENMLGHEDAAMAAASHAMQMAQATGDTAAISRLQMRFESIHDARTRLASARTGLAGLQAAASAAVAPRR